MMWDILKLTLGNLPYPKKQILLNINKLDHNF